LIQTELVFIMNVQIIKNTFDVPGCYADIVLICLGSRIIEMKKGTNINHPTLTHC